MAASWAADLAKLASDENCGRTILFCRRHYANLVVRSVAVTSTTRKLPEAVEMANQRRLLTRN
jgi:hypothetical protein